MPAQWDTPEQRPAAGDRQRVLRFNQNSHVFTPNGPLYSDCYEVVHYMNEKTLRLG